MVKNDNLIPDCGNYDDDDDDEPALADKATKTSSKTQAATTEKDGKTNNDNQKPSESPHYDSLKKIPLVEMGAKMLITFGDGPNPHPSVVSAALLGARTCLQRAILDARALRR